MELAWILGFIFGLRVILATEMTIPGPPTGIILQETLGLLITHCDLYTQRFYVRLDPWDVYRKHIRLPPKLTEGRLSGAQTHNTIEQAKQRTIHVLEQLEKFLTTERALNDEKRPKRFLGALLVAATGIGSLFSIGLSAANSVSLGALQRHMGELEEEMPEVSSSVSSLSAGKIPTYPVPLDLVENILKDANTSIVQPLQVHLACSLSSAIPLSVKSVPEM